MAILQLLSAILRLHVQALIQMTGTEVSFLPDIAHDTNQDVITLHGDWELVALVSLTALLRSLGCNGFQGLQNQESNPDDRNLKSKPYPHDHCT